MWSRRFWLVGLTSGVAVALLAYAAMCLVLYGFAALQRDRVDFIPFMMVWSGISAAIGVLVYPICWFKKIQRARIYSIERTFDLVMLTYGASCFVAGAIIFLFLIFFWCYLLIRWVPEMDWRTGFLAMLLVLSPVEAAVCVLTGILITIVPYVVIAIPIAFIHRWLLLAIFRPGAGLEAPAA